MTRFADALRNAMAAHTEENARWVAELAAKAEADHRAYLERPELDAGATTDTTTGHGGTTDEHPPPMG